MTNLLQYANRAWREEGYHVEHAEQYTRLGPTKMIAKDLFGFADKVCVKMVEGEWARGSLVFLQVTSWGNVSARANKIAREHREVALALLAVEGVRIVVEGWEKKKEPGDDGRWWQRRTLEITPEEIERRQA